MAEHNQLNPLWVLVGAVALATALFFLLPQGSNPSPNPTPPRPLPSGPDLTIVFVPAANTPAARNEARLDALIFGALCESISEFTEADRTLGPRLTKGSHIEDLRIYSRTLDLSGQSFATKYPKLPDTMREYLDNPLVLGPLGGDEKGNVTEEYRLKWIKAYHAIAGSAIYAAEQL